MCRKIRLIEANAKCRHLKNYPVKGLAAGFSLSEAQNLKPPPPHPPHTQCILVYTVVYLFTQGRGGRFNQREGEKGNS
jgi:hypothetical protein